MTTVRNLTWSVQAADELDDLLAELGPDQPGRGQPLLHADFLLPAVAHFGGAHTRLLIGRNEGRLEYAIPVEIRPRHYWRTFSPSQLPIAPVLYAAGAAAMPDLGRALRDAGTGALFVDVLHYDEGCNPATGKALFDITPYCTTMAIDARESFDDYWTARPKKLRDNIKRYYRRAESSFNLGFAVHRQTDELLAAFGRYAEIESGGWKGHQGTAIALDNTQGRFYADVLTRFANRGNARIFELTADGRTISSRIGIQAGGMLVFLKTTYDESFKKCSPGRLLLHRTIESTLADDDVSVLEFYTNLTADQAQWASETRPITHLTFYRNAVLRRTMQAYRGLKNAIARDRN